jgi:hypothetical protein
MNPLRPLTGIRRRLAENVLNSNFKRLGSIVRNGMCATEANKP